MTIDPTKRHDSPLAPRAPLPSACAKVGVGILAIAMNKDGKTVAVLSEACGHWQPVTPGSAMARGIPARHFQEFTIGDDGQWHRVLAIGTYNGERAFELVEGGQWQRSSTAAHGVLPTGSDIDRFDLKEGHWEKSDPSAPPKLAGLDRKNLTDWAAIISDKHWLLPRTPNNREAWLELAREVKQAVATGDWRSVDDIAGRHPRLVADVTHAANGWHAYWNHSRA